MASKQSKKAAKKKAAKKEAAKKKVAKKKTAKKKTPAKEKAAVKKAAPKKAVRKKRKRSKSKDKAAHYVNGKEFYEQIKEYYRTDDMKDILAESIHKIATGLSFAPNFINYSYKDEMVGDAVLKMFLALKNKKFNCETHNNPFSYFTTIAFHAFINRIKKEKKHRDTITRYQETVYGDMMQDVNGTGATVYTEAGTVEDDE
jgi:hypothetical protein